MYLMVLYHGAFLHAGGSVKRVDFTLLNNNIRYASLLLVSADKNVAIICDSVTCMLPSAHSTERGEGTLKNIW